MSSDFYTLSILPYAVIIIKICRAYTNTQEDFEDYYQEVCLQIWKSKDNFREQSEWSTWIYRLSLREIDKSVGSYQYLKAFHNWIKDQLSVNRRMAGYYYPLFFLSAVLGFWFSSGVQELFDEMIRDSPGIYLVYGIPIFWTLPVILVYQALSNEPHRQSYQGIFF